MVRSEVAELLALGTFPSSTNVSLNVIDQQEELLGKISPPVTDDEAKELVTLFGPDDYFGAAWTILHLIETSPHWPSSECLTNTSNEWVARLKKRCEEKGIRID